MSENVPTLIAGLTHATIEQEFIYLADPHAYFSDPPGRVNIKLVVVASVAEGRLRDPILLSCSFYREEMIGIIDEWARENVGLAIDKSLFTRKKEKPVSRLSREAKLDLIAEQASYAISWLQDCEDPDETGWIHSSIDTVGHQIACSLCQWFNLDGVPTAETVDYLELQKLPGREALRKNLELYLGEFEKEGGPS